MPRDRGAPDVALGAVLAGPDVLGGGPVFWVESTPTARLAQEILVRAEAALGGGPPQADGEAEWENGPPRRFGHSKVRPPEIVHRFREPSDAARTEACSNRVVSAVECHECPRTGPSSWIMNARPMRSCGGGSRCSSPPRPADERSGQSIDGPVRSGIVNVRDPPITRGSPQGPGAPSNGLDDSDPTVGLKPNANLTGGVGTVRRSPHRPSPRSSAMRSWASWAAAAWASSTGPAGPTEPPCALKMILARRPRRARGGARFLAEAEAVARLQHPNIVQIHDIGEPDGLPFFELEFVEGGSLDRRARRHTLAGQAAAELVEIAGTRRRRGAPPGHRPPRPEAGATSCWRPTARPRSPTSAWPSRWTRTAA